MVPKTQSTNGLVNIVLFFFPLGGGNFIFLQTSEWFFLGHFLSIMNRVQSFRGFAEERLGKRLDERVDDWHIVEPCLQAMQEGVLDVCAQNEEGRVLWRCYAMTAYQWRRTYSVLQRAGLEAVQKFLECRITKPEWVVQELERRLTWDAGLRRAWLAACTI